MSPAKRSLIPFRSKGGVETPIDGKIIDHGTIGGLHYEVYQRGVVHIFNDDKSMLFKKDCDLFEDQISKLDLSSMRIGDRKVIPGSGDNDNLVFSCGDGDIELKLEKRTYPLVEKLRNILGKGKKGKAEAA